MAKHTGLELDELLPAHIDPADVENLVATLAAALADDPVIRDALEACNLQPTSRAGWLASQAAVIVLVMHEIGQEVTRDQRRGE